jgi:tetratricopeptide (TPR) repeat protein
MMGKQGRNEPCACGSGKKYKQCCGLVSKSPAGVTDSQAVINALRTAWVNFEAQRLEQAREICQQLLKALPAQLDAQYLLGLTYLKDGDIESAIRILEPLAAHKNARPQFIASLGLTYHERGDLDSAIKAYRKAIALEPRLVDAHYNMHAALIDSKNLNPSIASLEEVLALNPQDYDAAFMLGLLHHYQGHLKEAETLFELMPNNNGLIQSRLDAWRYLKKSFGKSLPVVTGSIHGTFQLAIQAAKVEGMILEFGVRHGNSIRQLASLSQHQVHGFDSFEGLPEPWHDEAMGSYSTKGVIPQISESVTLHQGWFDKTLPEFLKSNSGQVRLINVDCDIYSSTKTVLDLLAPRLVSGSVIIFDEYVGNLHWRDDEFKAFQEAVKTYGWTYEYLAFSFFTKQVVVEIKTA